MVRQHPAVVPNLLVWENCVLGAEFFFINRQRRMVIELCEKWGFKLPLDSPAENLSVSGRQIVAVVNLLLRGCRVLIFDEVTAVLTQAEANALFALFAALKENGFSLALISHKLDETLALSDRATILRAGKTAATLDAKNADAHTVNALMFGEMGEEKEKAGFSYRKKRENEKKERFSVKNLRVEVAGSPFLRGINLTARGGTIIGVAGVRDSGLGTLESALTGFLPIKSGEIAVNGAVLAARRDPFSFREAGIAYLSADRTGECLAMSLPLRDSLVIHAHRKQPKRALLLDKPFLRCFARNIMEKAGLNRSIDDPASAFSGGQLQRLLLEREIAENAEILILSEAGWGLDARSRGVLAEKLRVFAQNGKAVLLFSSDIDELLRFSDEIFVLRNGAFSARVSIDDPAEFPAYKVRIAQAMT
jgi:simple sugar transport system ATP-binding protein